MSLPSIFNSMDVVLKEIQIDQILQTNSESAKYGLMLTADEAAEIIEVRNQLLKNYGRVELDIEAAKKLILNFSTSPFMNQEDFAAAIRELQEIFYYLKNETDDEIGDDNLIEIIKGLLNNTCEGSIELLQGREIEAFVRDYRLKRCKSDCI